LKWIRCRYCGASNEMGHRFCRRCGLDITIDPKGSLLRSGAFLIAAILFYLPANLYPVLQSSRFGLVQGSTILQGVVELWHEGDYPVAIVIFLASILVPVLKFLVLGYLLLSIASRRCKEIPQRVRLYYLIEVTGPWSLIDVFVVVLLVGLIHFQSMTILPGVGVSSFGLMVLLTMLAAQSLDVRILGVMCG